MSMTQDEAARLQQQIEQQYPQVDTELKQYANVWTILVRNPRTGEHFGIVSASDWQERLNTMLGGGYSADSQRLDAENDADIGIASG